MSQFQSTNSFQNSVISWTFGKNKRFKNSKTSNDKLYNISGVISMRGASMGYGTKYDLMPLNGRGSPSPNAYSIKSLFDSDGSRVHKKGIILAQKLKNLV